MRIAKPIPNPTREWRGCSAPLWRIWQNDSNLFQGGS